MNTPLRRFQTVRGDLKQVKRERDREHEQTR